MRGRPNADSSGIIITAVSGPWDAEMDQVTVASSLTDLCARITQARLPMPLAASLRAKLAVAMTALKSGDAGGARAAVDAAVVQISDRRARLRRTARRRPALHCRRREDVQRATVVAPPGRVNGAAGAPAREHPRWAGLSPTGGGQP